MAAASFTLGIEFVASVHASVLKRLSCTTERAPTSAVGTRTTENPTSNLVRMRRLSNQVNIRRGLSFKEADGRRPRAFGITVRHHTLRSKRHQLELLPM